MKIKFNNKAKPYVISILLAASLMPLGCTNNEQTIEKAITKQEVLIREDAPVLQSDQIAEKAKELTILIEGPASSGSGVLIQKEGNKYVVATAWHVIKNAKDGEELTAKTYDGKIHKLDIETGTKIKDVDLATIKFTSNKKYKIAKGGRREYARTGKKVYVSGYPLATTAVPTQLLRTLEGKVISNTSTFIPKGYQLLYTNPTLPGMSGGPVFDEQGGIAGIHGQAEIDSAQTQREGVAIKTGTNQAIPISYLKLFKNNMETQIDPNEELANSYIARASYMRRQMAEHRNQLSVEELRDTWGGAENPVIKAYLGESVNLITKAIEAKESSYAYYLRAIYRLNKKGNTEWYSTVGGNDLTLEDLEKAIELDPTNSAALFTLAAAGLGVDWDEYFKLEHVVIKKHFPKIFDKTLSDEERFKIRMKVDTELRVFDETSEELDKIILKMNPSILDIERAIDLDPYRVESYLSFSFILDAMLGRRKKWAIDVLEKGIKYNPHSAKLHADLGRMYSSSRFDNKYASKALKAYNMAIKLDPTQRSYYSDRGHFLYMQNEYTKAIEDFKMAISMGGMETEHKYLAQAYTSNKQYRESIKIYEKLGRLPYVKPQEQLVVQAKIATVYLKSGDTTKACELIGKNITQVKGFEEWSLIDWLRKNGSSYGFYHLERESLLKACSQ